MKKSAFLAAFFALCFTVPAQAETPRPIVIGDAKIAIPIPDGYEDASEARAAPTNTAILVTSEVEPWEAAAEFDEQIVLYGIGFRPSSQSIKAQKFDGIFERVRARIEAQVEGRTPSVADGLVSNELIEAIYWDSFGRNAYSLEITDNRERRKAFLIETKMVMPGVTSYPLLEEISFVRLDDQIVVFHSVRVDFSKVPCKDCEYPHVREDMLKAGLFIRDGLANTPLQS